MDYILDFENLDKHSFPLVGGKNAGLGEMMRAGISVPLGFAVTTCPYSRRSRARVYYRRTAQPWVRSLIQGIHILARHDLLSHK
jgi:hypothetical protein